jgi:transposase
VLCFKVEQRFTSGGFSGKTGKNDRNDAEAICEAVGRTSLRFVPIKSEEQQAVLMIHRARELVVSERTALVNQIRGLLGEFGIVVARHCHLVHQRPGRYSQGYP